MCKFVKKKTSCHEKITNKLHVISKNNFVSQRIFCSSSRPVMSRSQLGTNQSLHESCLFMKYDISHEADLLPVP